MGLDLGMSVVFLKKACAVLPPPPPRLRKLFRVASVHGKRWWVKAAAFVLGAMLRPLALARVWGGFLGLGLGRDPCTVLHNGQTRGASCVLRGPLRVHEARCPPLLPSR